MDVTSRLKKQGVPIITAMLIVLFVYTAVSKLLAPDTFRHQMLNQPFPEALSLALVWLLPMIELTTAGCLLIAPLHRLGLLLSCLLMAAFTGYVALVYFGAFERVPCSCGGVLKQLSWGEHLALNGVFLMLAAVGMRWAVDNEQWTINN